MSESERSILGWPIFKYKYDEDIANSPTKAAPQPPQPNFLLSLFNSNSNPNPNVNKDQLLATNPDNSKRLPGPKIIKAKDLDDYFALIIIYNNIDSADKGNDYLKACLRYYKETKFRELVDNKLEELKDDLNKNKNNANEDANGVARRLSNFNNTNEELIRKHIGTKETNSTQAKKNPFIISEPGKSHPVQRPLLPPNNYPENNSPEPRSKTSNSSKSVTGSNADSFPDYRGNYVAGSKDDDNNPFENIFKAFTSPFMAQTDNSTNTGYLNSQTNPNTTDLFYDRERAIIGTEDGGKGRGIAAFGVAGKNHLERVAEKEGAEPRSIKPNPPPQQLDSGFFQGHGLRLNLLTSLLAPKDKDNSGPPSTSPSPSGPRGRAQFNPGSTFNWGGSAYGASAFSKKNGITPTEWEKQDQSLREILEGIGRKAGVFYDELKEPNQGGGRGKW